MIKQLIKGKHMKSLFILLVLVIGCGRDDNKNTPAPVVTNTLNGTEWMLEDQDSGKYYYLQVKENNYVLATMYFTTANTMLAEAEGGTLTFPTTNTLGFTPAKSSCKGVKAGAMKPKSVNYTVTGKSLTISSNSSTAVFTRMYSSDDDDDEDSDLIITYGCFVNTEFINNPIN